MALTVKGDTFDINASNILACTEIYTQQTFQDLQILRFHKNTPFYVAIIQENGKYFAFDASAFLNSYILHFEKTQEDYPNPFTRKKIEEQAVKIFESTSENPSFKEVTSFSSIKDFSQSLPIILSDPDLPRDKRSFYQYLLGNSILRQLDSSPLLEQPAKEDLIIEKIIKTIFLLEEAAHLSTKEDKFYSERKLELAYLFKRFGHPQKYLYWLLSYWNDFDAIPCNKSLIELGNAFQMNNKCKTALTYYQVAALKGSQLALAKTIEYYDLISSSKRRKIHASFWREYLPNNWKKKK